MTIERRPFESLGRFQLDWLNARHHFSFGGYFDPQRMGVGPLRVWNDDQIRPSSGFDPHPHRDMEIITYVRTGAISHMDHLGNEGRTVAGDVQVMSAGTGIVHAEYNLEDDLTEIFQIWIQPKGRGGAPCWETRAFPKDTWAGGLTALASGQDGISGALPIDQDATLYAASLAAGQTIEHGLGKDRQGYLVPASGRLRLAGVELAARDGAVIRDEPGLVLEALEESEVLLADLPR